METEEEDENASAYYNQEVVGMGNRYPIDILSAD